MRTGKPTQAHSLPSNLARSLDFEVGKPRDLFDTLANTLATLSSTPCLRSALIRSPYFFGKSRDATHARRDDRLEEMYAGRGVPEDDAEAIKWYRLAAEQGNVDAQYDLGFMYAFGPGVPQDDAEAVKWYRLAAEQGHPDAQFNLGLMYVKGKGVPQDYAEAMKWYRRAAEQGHAVAQTNLGIMYEYGQGVPQDYAETMKWYRKAAEQGNAIAQSNLGVMYSNRETPKPLPYMRPRLYWAGASPCS